MAIREIFRYTIDYSEIDIRREVLKMDANSSDHQKLVMTIAVIEQLNSIKVFKENSFGILSGCYGINDKLTYGERTALLGYFNKPTALKWEQIKQTGVFGLIDAELVWARWLSANGRSVNLDKEFPSSQEFNQMLRWYAVIDDEELDKSIQEVDEKIAQLNSMIEDCISGAHLRVVKD